MIDIAIRNLSDPVFSYLYEFFWIFLQNLYSRIDFSFFWNYYLELDYWSLFLSHIGIILNLNFIIKILKKNIQSLIRNILNKENLERFILKILKLVIDLVKKCCFILKILFEFLIFEFSHLRRKTLESKIAEKEKSPRTIKESNKKVCFSNGSKQILKEWLKSNIENPFPCHKTKIELADQANLTYAQINNWFKLFRHRQLKKSRTTIFTLKE